MSINVVCRPGFFTFIVQPSGLLFHTIILSLHHRPLGFLCSPATCAVSPTSKRRLLPLFLLCSRLFAGVFPCCRLFTGVFPYSKLFAGVFPCSTAHSHATSLIPHSPATSPQVPIWPLLSRSLLHNWFEVFCSFYIRNTSMKFSFSRIMTMEILIKNNKKNGSVYGRWERRGCAW